MFNVLLYTRKLEAVGFSREQAETHMQMLSEIVDETLATKQDIKNLEMQFERLEYRLTIKLGTIVTIALGAFAAISKIL
jgi:hypothetical protein